MIYLAFVKPEPFATVPAPTVAGNCPQTDQNTNIYFRFVEEKRFLERSSVFSSGEAFSRVEKHFVKRRSVFSSDEAFSKEEKRFL